MGLRCGAGLEVGRHNFSIVYILQHFQRGQSGLKVSWNQIEAGDEIKQILSILIFNYYMNSIDGLW